MKKLLFPIAFLLAALIASTQSDPEQPGKKQRPFVIRVTTNDSKAMTGLLRSINDSQLVLLRSLKPAPSPVSAHDQFQIPAENIKSLTVRRKNSALKGALIGLGVGALTGIIVGLADGDDPVYTDPVYDPFSAIAVSISNSFAMTAGEKAVVGGLVLGAGGAIIGTIIGAVVKKKFIIGGKKEKFRDLQAELMMRLVQK
jgi:hypothetical protein